MSNAWYYADRLRQQRGPVAAADLAAALQRGELDMATLVWNESLPNWVPLAQVAAQLGIAGAPPPLQRAAAPRRAATPRKGGGGKIVAIVLLSLLGCLLVFGGIIAAIAIPAYHDYTTRSYTSQALVAGSTHRVEVAEFWFSNQRCPVNGDTGFGDAESYAGPYVRSITFGPGGGGCEIRILLTRPGANRAENAEIVLRLDADGSWNDSAVNIATRHLPMSLRR